MLGSIPSDNRVSNQALKKAKVQMSTKYLKRQGHALFHLDNLLLKPKLLLPLRYVQPISGLGHHTMLEFDDPTKAVWKYTSLEYCLTIGCMYLPSYLDRI